MSATYRYAAAALSVIVCSQALAEVLLDDVMVTAARVEQPVSEVIGSVTVITREQIQARQSSSVQELLRGELGVDIYNSGGLGKASAIYLRGTNSSQTLILVDGVRLGSATLGITSIEFIPVEQIERIEIVRGPRSSLYGSDAIGGVIQIFTRQNQGVNASASVGRYDTQSYTAGFGLQQSALRFSVNGSYTQSAGFDARGSYPDFDFNCFCTVTALEHDRDGYRNSSATARVGYAFGQLADLELSTLYTQGLTEYDGSFVNETRFRNTAPTARLRLTPTESVNITLSGGITQDKSENFKDNAYQSRFNTEKRSANAQVDWQVAQQRFSAGVDYLNDLVDSDTTYTVAQRDNLGLYVQYLGKVATHELSASLRHDDNQQFGTHDTGNLGWKWFVLERALAINAGWGQGFHAPSFNDLYYPYGYGNPELQPERSQSYELGISGQYSWLDWSLQTYSTRATDLIGYDANFFPINIDKARLQGAELNLSGQWRKFNAALNYTALDPRSHQAGANYDHILARRARQAGRLELGYDFGRLRASAVVNAVGPRYEDLANTQRMGGYALVDLRGELKLNKVLKLQIKLGNVFDRDYETVQFYRQEGRNLYLTLRYQQ